jgi:hypothetical protein
MEIRQVFDQADVEIENSTPGKETVAWRKILGVGQ